MMARSGIFVVFEGIDGSGKSTQAARLLERLRSKGLPAVLFREPTDGRWGRLIRRNAARAGSLSAGKQLDLFIRDRREDVGRNIGPALKAGTIVILDRYYYSTMAYQGALGLDVARIRRLNREFAPEPDLVFIFDIPPGRGLARVAGRGGRDELFEREDYLEKVARIFRSMKGRRFIHIDGSGGRAALAREVFERVRELLGEKGYPLKAAGRKAKAPRAS